MNAQDDLQALLDKQSIRELVFAYSRAVDRQDFGLLRTLFADDAFEDHGGLYRGPASGYVDWLQTAMVACDVTTHSVHNHTIGFSSATEAEGEVYVTAYHRLHAKQGFEEIVEGLRYLDRYTKRKGTWQFAHRTLVNDWAQVGPAFWDIEHPTLRGTPVGKADASDPLYTKLSHPLFRRQ